jgi:3-dehydroquinate synthase
MAPILIKTGLQSYEAHVGRGLLERAGALISAKLKGPSCAVISDDNVARIFADRVLLNLTRAGFKPLLIIVSSGEKSKSLREVETICNQMSNAGLDRSSFVLALGGGVVGDLAGFVAAVYHRGIPYVQMPTTMLAQVDSSIGGKTAVNITRGKNLIGAWHQPVMVISDTDTLTTLPGREFRQGFAEMVKHAVIRDPSMLEMLEHFRPEELPDLIRRNIAIKASIIGVDERETTGQRALLNFGHTVGHAIERAGGFCELLHGEAISLGIVAACEISVRKAGLSEKDRDRIVNLLRRFDLPTWLPPDFPREKILEEIRFDKKSASGQLRFVVISEIGSAHVTTEVAMEDIYEVVSAGLQVSSKDLE